MNTILILAGNSKFITSGTQTQVHQPLGASTVFIFNQLLLQRRTKLPVNRIDKIFPSTSCTNKALLANSTRPYQNILSIYKLKILFNATLHFEKNRIDIRTINQAISQ